MCSYRYVCSVLYILFPSCQLALFDYPDRGFSVFFPSDVRQMLRYNWQRPGTACTLPNELCCSVYCLCVNVYCTVLYCTVLYCTVLYCTLLYCTVLYCTVLYCTVLYCTVLYCTVLLPPGVNPITFKYIMS